MAYAPQFNSGLAGKTAADPAPDKVSTPGKKTQVEAAAHALEAATPADLVAEVEARMGKTFSDGGGYSFQIVAPSSFQIVTAPPGKYKGKLDRSKKEAWEAVAKLMVLRLPIEKPTPVQVAPPPLKAAVGQPAPNQSLVPAKAPSMLESLIDRVQGGVHDAMSSVSSYFGRGDAPSQSATPAAVVSKPPVLDVAPVDTKKAAVADAKDTSKPVASLPKGDGKGANTLELARTRAALGDEGTTYNINMSSDLANSMVAGASDQTTFYCSGLSIWTLAASGIDVKQPILGSDNKPYEFKTGTKKTKSGEVDVTSKITMKAIIDGEPASVEALATARKNGQTKGGLIEGDFHSEKNGGQGHLAAWNGDEADLSVRGAAGAFVLTGLGAEVPENQQKPGDFVQMHRRGKDGLHHGEGHAWQVNEVVATGSAMFGLPRSPLAVDGNTAVGWRTTKFRILDTTDPLLVGDHVVIQAARLEANVKTSMLGNQDKIAKHRKEVAAEKAEAKAAATQAAKDQKGMSKEDRKAAQAADKEAAKLAAAEREAKDKEFDESLGDAGVQITGMHGVPAGEAVFVGRLGASPWSGWGAATKESATAHASATPSSSANAATTPVAQPTPAAVTPPVVETPQVQAQEPAQVQQAAPVQEAAHVQQAAAVHQEGARPRTGGRITVEE